MNRLNFLLKKRCIDWELYSNRFMVMHVIEMQQYITNIKQWEFIILQNEYSHVCEMSIFVSKMHNTCVAVVEWPFVCNHRSHLVSSFFRVYFYLTSHTINQMCIVFIMAYQNFVWNSYQKCMTNWIIFITCIICKIGQIVCKFEKC